MSPKAHILVVEDDPIDQLAMRRAAANGRVPYDVTIVPSVADARDALRSGAFAAVVTDYALADGSALDVLEVAGGTPVVIVTGSGDEQRAVLGLKAGAGDYLVKDSERRYLDALPAAIEFARHDNERDRMLRMLVHALQNIGEAVYVNDLDGNVIFVNDAFTAMFGWTPAELLGRSTELTRAEQAGDLRVRTKAGTEVVVALTRSSVRDARGRTIGTVGITRDMTERLAMERTLRELAVRDELTGLFNRRELMRMLEDEAERSQRTRAPLSLLLIDIDHFKSINDRFGHPAGDAVLAALGGLVRAQVRTIDRPARYGGEEMAVILPDTDAAGALVLAERLRAAVAGSAFVAGNETLTVTASFGVATMPLNASSVHELIEAADRALYQAKREGRNRVVQSVTAAPKRLVA